MASLSLCASLKAQAGAWTGTDVGTTGVAGSDSYNNTTGVYTIAGSGADINGTADACHFVYQSLTADGELTARVATVQNTNALAKAGLMVRQSTAVGAINAFIAVTPTSGILSQQRAALNGTTVSTTTTASVAPYWLRIIKDGTLISVYQAPDGATWTYEGAIRLSSLTSPVDIGFAVTSHSNTVLCTATFDNITLTPATSFAPPLPWHDQDIGSPGQAGQVHDEQYLWSLYGGGAGITGTADNFHFGYQTMSGNGEIIAQVAGLSASTASAGVLMRQDLTTGSAEASVLFNSTNGVKYGYRTTSSGTLSTVAGATGAVPYWVKLVRAGNVFSGYQSVDGLTWTLVSSQTITMTGTIYAGVGATSGNNSILAMAVLDRIYVIPSGGYLGTGGISSGASHNLYLQSTGNVYAWGLNTNGQLGDGTTTQRTSPVQVTTLSGMAGVAAGASHSLALKNDGTVWVWGLNTNGQLGDGTTTQRTAPFKLTTLSGIIALSAGASHSLALGSDGTVWVWGLNTNGQLGDGTTTQHTSPEQLTSLKGIVAISAGGSHSLALRDDGAVFAWGNNATGQLGLGTTTQHTSPTQITTLSNVAWVSAGTSHSLMVGDDGSVWAWGDNSSGEIGDGSTTQRTSPVQVTSVSGILTAQASNLFSLALKSDGTVLGWGKNSSGQLGNNTTTQQNSPVQASGLANAVAISAGTSHSTAITSDSGIWAWGANTNGQLGVGTTTASLIPKSLKPVITSASTATGTVGVAFSYTMVASSFPTSYNATGLPAGLSINTSTGVITGTPSVAGVSSVTLSATNISGVGTATLTLTINPPKPVITSSSTATGTKGVAFNYQITATNSPASYSATGLPTGLSVNTSTGLISGTPTATGASSVTLGATNVTGTGTATLTLTINPPKPVITSATTATGTKGSSFSYQIVATNTPTSYSATGLPAGITVSATTGLISGTPTGTGVSTVTLGATNAGGTGNATLTLTVNPPAPVISSSGTASGINGTAFSYTITASNTPTSFNATGLPTGLSVNTTTGVISGTPTVTGVSSVTLSAINAGGTGTKTLTLTVNPPAPVISSAATASAVNSTSFSYQITASNSPTSYNATGLPAGLSVNTGTGLISGTPTVTGVSSVTLSAINAGGTGTKTLTLTVNPPAPAISSPVAASGLTAAVFSYQITASNTPTSFNATGLPAGLSINTSTGVITGTPTAAGTSVVSLSATNAGGTGTASLTLVVSQPPPVTTGLALWLKAESGVTADGSGNVGQWQDLSVGSHLIAQGTAANKPSRVTDPNTGTPALRFSGSQWLSSTDLMSTNADMTIITVASTTQPTYEEYSTWLGNFGTDTARAVGYSNQDQLINAANDSLNGGPVPNASTFNVETTTLDSARTGVTYYRNGIQTGTSTFGTALQALSPGISVGSAYTGAAPWYGDIREVLVYSHKLSSTELQQVGVYLADKYGLYNPNATWPQSYSAAVQAEITRNQWSKAQADAYVAFQAANPSMLTNGLTIWLKADAGITKDGSGNVGQWIDQSQGNVVTQNNLANEPSFVATDSNGAPGVRFTGSSNLTSTANLGAGLNADMTIVTVASTSTPGNQEYAAYLGSPVSSTARALGYSNSSQLFDFYGNSVQGGPAPAANTFNVEMASLNSTTSSVAFYRNGIATGTAAVSGLQNLSSGITVGSFFGGGSAWQGDISEVLVYDHQLSSSEMQQVEIYLANKYGTPFPQPVISSPTTANGTTGLAFNYTISASYAPTSYSATGLPAGLSLNTTTGVISGTPTTTGTSTVTLSATNAGGTGTATLTLNIYAQLPPVINSGSSAIGTVGGTFNYTITGTNAPTSYGATGLPAGLTLNTSTGVISGTPTTSGTFTVTLSATNTWGTGTASLTVITYPTLAVTSGLTAWLRADAGVVTDASGNVSQWADQTSNHNDAVQSSSGLRPAPATNVMQGEPVVRFNGTSTYLAMPTCIHDNFSMVVLFRSSLGTGAGGQWWAAGGIVDGETSGTVNDFGMSLDQTGKVLTGVGNPDTSVISQTGGYNDGNGHIATFTRTESSGSFSQYIDSILQGSATGNTGTLNSPPQLDIGATQTLSNYFGGDVAEVILYNRVLTTSEQQQVEAYLANKYGLYNPNATWPLTYTSAVQAEIARNHWNKSQADAYVAFQAANPSMLTNGLAVWLKADAGITKDGSGNVSQWVDQAEGNVVTQNTLANEPSFVAFDSNGAPGLHFNGSSTLVGNPGFSGLNADMTIVTVASTSTPGNQEYAAYLGSPVSSTARALGYSNSSQLFDFYGNSVQGGPAPAANTFNVEMASLNSTTSSVAFYRNGIATGTAAVSGLQNLSSGITVGSFFGGGSAWQGDISEVLVYDHQLSSSEMQQVGLYLANKYALYNPSATWISSYTAAVQAEITRNQWSKKQADAYVAFQSANPSMLTTGLMTWLKADAGVTTSGSNVTGWVDQTGNSTVTQSTVGNQPGFVSSDSNGMPALRFNGSQWLSNTAVWSGGVNADMTVITVASTTQPTYEEYSAWMGNFGTDTARAVGYSNQEELLNACNDSLNGASVPAINTFNVEATTLDSTRKNVTYYRNGVQTATATFANSLQSVSPGLTVGSAYTGAAPWNGDISEVLIYDHQLSSTEMQQVSVYLANKYGLYNPNATWISSYTAAVQAEINRNQWTKQQTDAYVALQTNNPSMLTTGIVTWLKADSGVTHDGGGNISTWVDQTGNYTVNQSVAANQPKWVASDVNGVPGLRFSGSQWLSNLNSWGSGLTADMTIITVVSTTQPTAEEYSAWMGNYNTDTARAVGYSYSAQVLNASNDARNGFASPSAGSINVEAVTLDSTRKAVTYFRNGAQTATASFTNALQSVTPGFSIGSAYTGGAPWSGDINEVLVYDHQLSSAEMQQVSNYLTNKYGITPPIPVITSASSASGTSGVAFSYAITASNSPTSYSATGLPTGLSINTSTGVISGTPSATGTSTITLHATNAGGPATATLTLTVYPAAAPVITSSTTASGTVSAAFNYAITASNVPTSYSATGLPTGLSVNAATGVITGTPSAVSTSTVTLKAINAYGTGTQTLTLTIYPTLSVTSGLAAWFHADAGVVVTGGSVTQWKDQSSNQYAISQSSGADAPILGTDPGSGNPTLTFNGNQFLSNTSDQVAVTGDVTIITVAANSSPTTTSTQLVIGSPSSNAQRALVHDAGKESLYNGSTFADGGAIPGSSGLNINTVTYSQSGSLASFYSQGVPAGTASLTAANVNAGLTVGSLLYYAPNLAWSGSIAEVIIYNRVLTTTERQQVELYLANKYSTYAPGASWIAGYSTAVQAEINRNQWSKKQTDTYVALQSANPSMLTNGLLTWLKADAGITTSGGNVTSWVDQTGNSTVTQGTVANQPALIASDINGVPALRFNGSQSLHSSNGWGNGVNADMTVITVASTTQPTYEEYSAWMGNLNTDTARAVGYVYQKQVLNASNDAVTGGAAPTVSTFNVEATTLDSTRTTVTYYRNGSQAATGTFANALQSVSPGFAVGATSSGIAGWYGDISEVLVYDHQLSTAEMQQVSVYLANKYGLYNPNATWPQAYSTAVQAEITRNQWTKAQADAYVAFQAANPSMMTNGLKLWLKADAGITKGIGNNVTGWADQTGNYSLNQNSIYGQPTLINSDSNAKPALRFGASQALTNPSSLGIGVNADMTMITVGMTTATSASEYALYLGDGTTEKNRASGYKNLAEYFDASGSSATGGTVPGNGIFVAETTSINAALSTVTFYQNGTQTGTGTLSGIQNINSGISVGNAWQGDISEVLVYDHQLSSAELQQVSLYLANKYGLYYPTASWISSYTTAQQTQINANQWNKAQADAYVQISQTLPVATGLTAWFRADSGIIKDPDTGAVTTWQDSGMNHNDVSQQSGAANEPTFAADPTTGKPSIHFNGSQYLSNYNNYPNVNDVTIITVASTPSPSSLSYATQVAIGNGANNSVGYVRGLVYDSGDQTFWNGSFYFSHGGSVDQTSALTVNAMTYSSSTSTVSFYKNGVVNGTLTSNNRPVSQGLSIGSGYFFSNGNDWNGNISEVLIYNRVLNSTELAAIQTYLSGKYATYAYSAPAISPNGGAFASSATVTLSGAISPAIIRYTTDGSAPTNASTQYTAPFSLTQDTTVNCAIFSSGVQVSPVATAQFWIGDTNHIGIPDAWQIQYFGATGINPNAQSPGGSGLTNLQAYQWGYNPTMFSTNGDGLSDLVNHQLGYAGNNYDINGYGLTNAQQLALGLDPFDTGVNPPPPTPPTPNPNDHTAPVIMLSQPANATLLP